MGRFPSIVVLFSTFLEEVDGPVHCLSGAP